MPKDTNLKTDPQLIREAKINEGKKLADSKLTLWKTGRQEQIEKDYEKELAAIKTDQMIEDEAKAIWERKLVAIKENWRNHLENLRYDLQRREAGLNQQYTDIFKELSVKYNEKNQQIQDEYEKASAEIERQLNEEAKELTKRREELSVGLENVKKDNEKKFQEINKKRNKIYQEIDKLTEEINAKNRRREDTRALEHKQDELQETLTSLLKDMSGYIEKETSLKEELKKVEAQLNPEAVGKKRRALRDPYFNERDRKAGELLKEQQKEMTERKAELLNEIAKGKKKLEEDEKLPWNPGMYGSQKDQLQTDKERALAAAKADREKAAQNKAAAEEEMKMTGEKLFDRLYWGVEFGVDAETLAKSPKRNHKPNTAEFTAMVDALDKVTKAAGKCDESPEAEAELRRSCLEAYKQCQNYIDAKKNQGVLTNFFRKQQGIDRINMAAGMMEKLKGYCPDLEQALKNEVQEVQKKKAAGSKHKEQKVNVKAELDAAKAELAKKNGQKDLKQNGSKKMNQKMEQGPKQQGGMAPR